MKINMKQWFESLKTNAHKKAMPVLSFPCVQLLDITVRKLISDADLQAKGMAAVAQRCDSLASVSMMDLSVEAEAFGAAVNFPEDEVPAVTGRLIESMADAQSLKVPDVGAGRTGLYISAIEKAVRLIADRPVFAGVIGPFSLAGRLMDMTEIMVNCYVEPETVHATLEKAAQFTEAYIIAFKKAGANGVVMAEPAAGLLSPELNAEFSIPYVKRIIDAVSDDNFGFIYHNCGNVIPLMSDIMTLGADAYHFGNAIELVQAAELIPENVIFMGNIDPAGEFRNGTPESITEATKQLLNKCGGYSNFVLSSGCDIPPLSPWDNIDAFFKAAAEYYSDK